MIHKVLVDEAGKEITINGVQVYLGAYSEMHDIVDMVYNVFHAIQESRFDVDYLNTEVVAC